MASDAKRLGKARSFFEPATDRRQQQKNEIYLSVARLFRNQGILLSERERTLMCDILRRLTGHVEMAIRIALAERLADDPGAPLELILLLVDDHIEIARPLILRSTTLRDEDLLDLIARADDARRILCAERPNIGERVTSALATCDAEPVLVALVRNITASFTSATYEALVEKSRRIAVLQEPLARRPDLPPALAERMCGWVSEVLKNFLVQHRQIPAERVDALVGDASLDLHFGGRFHASGNVSKLVDKLSTAGQLRTGFLMRVLQQGQKDLFDLAFARMLDLEPNDFRRFYYANDCERVALACRAIGIDRSAFPTVWSLSARNRGYVSPLRLDERRKVDAVFDLTKPEALARLRRRSSHLAIQERG